MIRLGLKKIVIAVILIGSFTAWDVFAASSNNITLKVKVIDSFDSTSPITTASGVDSLWHNTPVTVTLSAQDQAFSSEPDSNTKLLLRLDGEDGSNAFKDEAGKAITPNGNTQIDTAQSKFGGGSSFFDGSGDYLTIPGSPDWAFGSGNFTIDFWVRFNDLATAQSIISQSANDGANNIWNIFRNTDNKLYMSFISNGVTKGYYYTNSLSLSTGVWYHLAFVRNGTRVLIFVDGVSQTLTEYAAFGSNDVGDIAAPLWIGGRDLTGSNLWFNGWLDELRISKGIARWTADFTLPTAYSSGVSRTYYSTDGSTPNILYTNPFTLTDDGQYTIKYYSIDKAGNPEAVKTAANKVRIDKTPPLANIIINSQDQTSESWDVSLNLFADDALSGMGQGAQMQLSNDNSNWSNPEDYSDAKPWKLSSGFGTKTVYARFKDVAGNWSEPVSDSIELVNVPKERIYIYLNAKRVAMEENGKKYFFHSDHLGSTNVVTDESGSQVKYIDYKPYGETKLEEGSLKAQRKFTGKELDDSTGLYDYSARQYDARIGRFISADTVDPDLTNPQSLNRYSYTLNNPLKYTDPAGHTPLAIAMFIPGAQEIAALVTGYLILRWSFEQLSRAVETMPTINLGFKLPGFDRSAKSPPSVESPTVVEQKYTPEGMTYTEMPDSSVMVSKTLPKTFRHYGYEKDAESLKKGLQPDSYATNAIGRPMKGKTAEQKLSLEHPTPPDAYYKVKPKPVTSIKGPSDVKPIPGRTGGGKEYKFPKGTGKGTVTGPYKIEP